MNSQHALGEGGGDFFSHACVIACSTIPEKNEALLKRSQEKSMLLFFSLSAS